MQQEKVSRWGIATSTTSLPYSSSDPFVLPMVHNNTMDAPYNYELEHLYSNFPPGGEAPPDSVTSASNILTNAMEFSSQPEHVTDYHDNCQSCGIVPRFQRVDVSPSQTMFFEQFMFDTFDHIDVNNMISPTSMLFSQGQDIIQPQSVIPAAVNTRTSDMHALSDTASETPSVNEVTSSSSQEGYTNHTAQSLIVGQDIIPCQGDAPFIPPLSVLSASWIDSTLHTYGTPAVAAQSNFIEHSVPTVGTQSFTDMEFDNAQAVVDAVQNTGGEAYHCDDTIWSKDGHIQEAWDSPPDLVQDEGTPDGASNNNTPKDVLTASTSPESVTNTLPTRRKKGPRLHKCKVCKKDFPRPSGLATHMNIHSGERPYACMFPGCELRFTVRSNAKRHLKVHGINPSDVRSGPTPYIVNFNDPIVHSIDMRLGNPKRIRWVQVPASLRQYKNAGHLRSEASSEEDYEEDDGAITAASGPLPQVLSPSDDGLEGRLGGSTSEDEGSHLYHPAQWNGMPGRAN